MPDDPSLLLDAIAAITATVVTILGSQLLGFAISIQDLALMGPRDQPLVGARINQTRRELKRIEQARKERRDGPPPLEIACPVAGAERADITAFRNELGYLGVELDAASDVLAD